MGIDHRSLMLATHVPIDTTKSWYYQFKLDGWRATYSSNGNVFTSRRGKDVSSYVQPSETETLETLPEGTVLDGEIINISMSPTGKYVMNPYDIPSKENNEFIPFDVLQWGHVDMRGKPLSERVEFLREEVGPNYGVRTVFGTYNFEEIWSVVTLQNIEGVVAKDPQSVYRAGRSDKWVKVFNPGWRREGP